MIEADLEFLMRAALKVETIRERSRQSWASYCVAGGRGHARQTHAARHVRERAEPVRRVLKFERKLREQLEKLAAQLDETKRTESHAGAC